MNGDGICHTSSFVIRRVGVSARTTGLTEPHQPGFFDAWRAAVMLSQDEREYLASVTERAKALREVFNGNGANVDKAREELAGVIGQPGRLLDILRRCDRLYGLGDRTHRRLDWIGGEWERGPHGYPAIWDSLADVEVLVDLERCLGQADEAGAVSMDEEWSRPMPLTDIADRILKDPKKHRKLRGLYAPDRLKQIGGKSSKSWQIRLDGLPANIRKELERP
jgi:hypothetical protein